MKAILAALALALGLSAVAPAYAGSQPYQEVHNGYNNRSGIWVTVYDNWPEMQVSHFCLKPGQWTRVGIAPSPFGKSIRMEVTENYDCTGRVVCNTKSGVHTDSRATVIWDDPQQRGCWIRFHG